MTEIGTSDSSANSHPPSNPPIYDDKTQICVPFIVSHLKTHHAQNPSRPFFIGLNGVQGAGKSTLVSALAERLQMTEHLETLVCSIDDLYLTHEDQEKLAREHADNPLVQHRGEPGTHDMALARELFTALLAGQPIAVPRYDKSAHNGRGDRVPVSEWKLVNGPSQPKIQVIIFEGWCVGFRSLSSGEVAQKRAASASASSFAVTTLHKYKLEDLLFVNDRLAEYDVVTDAFDAFIHIDAEETGFVYEWRLQQERALRQEKGAGMTDGEVIKFVDGYYPAYELYTEALRNGIFKGPGHQGRQLRLVVGRDRRVKQIIGI